MSLILLLVVYQLWGTGIHTTEAQADLRKQFAQRAGRPWPTRRDHRRRPPPPIRPARRPPCRSRPTDLSIPVPKPGDPIGIIDIPRIGSNFVFVEGVDLKYLSEGPGHFPGTPLPGQAGNAAIAGHRTTYKAPFNRIDELQPGDEIFITTLQGHFTYKVMAQPNPDDPTGPTLGHVIVQAHRRARSSTDKGRNQLTLMACHPKYYATNRIVVEALLVGNPAPSRRAAPTAHVAPDRAGRAEQRRPDASGVPAAAAGACWPR